jgi:hypothetical protein
MRERALKIVLVVVGLFFLAAIYPLAWMKVEESVRMLMSLYVTLGVFLLLAARNPAEHRSLIAFAAWSSFAHAGVMTVQVSWNLIPRRELIGVVVLAVIGIVLIALRPAKLKVATA